MTAAARDTILIVGGSSDIGLELIRHLAGGDSLILAHCNHSRHKLEALRAELPQVELLPMVADLGQAGGAEQLIAQVKEKALPNKIVHLPAPKFGYVRFKDSSWGDFQRNLDVQVRSLYEVSHAFLPEMAKKNAGKLVVVLSSVTLNVPPAALAHYVTAKYALLGLVRALAAEYSSRRLNINAVSPSMVETAFLEQLPPRMVEIAASQSPWRRNATPADVAASIAFLLSSKADYLTGLNLPLAGGSVF